MRNFVLFLSLIAFTGCSLLQPTEQTVSFKCSEQDTFVLVNGERYNCPGNTKVRRDKPMTIEAHKPGFDVYHKYITPHLGATFYLDILGTCVWFFPVFGTFSPGAWELDQTEFDIRLYTSQKAEMQ